MSKAPPRSRADGIFMVALIVCGALIVGGLAYVVGREVFSSIGHK